MGFFLFILISLCVIGGIFYYFIRKAIVGVNYLKDTIVNREELTSEKLISIINKYAEHFEASILTDNKPEDNLDIGVICKQNWNERVICIDINNISQGYLLFKCYMIMNNNFSEDELVQTLNEWNNKDNEFNAKTQLKNGKICLEHQYFFSDSLSSKDLCSELIMMNETADNFITALRLKYNVLNDEEEDDDDIELPINKITPQNIIKIIDKKDFPKARPVGDVAIELFSKEYQIYLYVSLEHIADEYLLLTYFIDAENIKKTENVKISIFDDKLESLVYNYNNSKESFDPKAYYDGQSFSLLDKFYFTDCISSYSLNYQLSQFARSVNIFINKYPIDKIIMESK